MMKWVFSLVVLLVGVTCRDYPTNPSEIRAVVTATTDDYLLASGYQDSTGADLLVWSDSFYTCYPTPVGGDFRAPGCFRGVPARYRWQCLPSSTWANWKLIPVGSFNGRSSTISCALGGTGLHVQMELNDSIGSSQAGTIVVDTGAYTTRYRVKKDFTLSRVPWANGPRDTIYWANWYAVPYTQLIIVATRAQSLFGYTLPKTPVHVNNHGVDCCEPNTATYDSVFLSGGSINPTQNWNYQNVSTMWHEFGHHYVNRALHLNPTDSHGPADSTYHYSELGEGLAEFIGGWAGSTLQYAVRYSLGLPEAVEEWSPMNNAPDDWDMERDSLRSKAYTGQAGGWNLMPEFYLGGFLNDLVDQISDTNGFHNTTGSGLNADDDSASNWGTRYLADVLTGNVGGGTAKCTITWPAGIGGGVHSGPDHLQDLIMCLEHSTKIQLAVPTQFRKFFRDDAISVVETVTEPAGWSASKVRQLWRLALYNSGLRYFKFNTGSGWKCMTTVGDSVYWTGISGGPNGYAYRFGGVGGTNGSNSWIPSDATGAVGHYVDEPGLGSQFTVQITGGTNVYPGIKFDSVGAAGTWFSYLHGTQRIHFSEQEVAAIPIDLQGAVRFSIGQTCP